MTIFALLLLLLWLLPTLLFLGVAALAVPAVLAKRWSRGAGFSVGAGELGR